MKIDSAREIDSICWQIRQAYFTRGANRARIDKLFNASPPYSADEVEANHIAVNVNFGEAMRLAHDARAQFANAFTKPGQYFTARTDMGPRHRRAGNLSLRIRAGKPAGMRAHGAGQVDAHGQDRP